MIDFIKLNFCAYFVTFDIGGPTLVFTAVFQSSEAVNVFCIVPLSIFLLHTVIGTVRSYHLTADDPLKGTESGNGFVRRYLTSIVLQGASPNR